MLSLSVWFKMYISIFAFHVIFLISEQSFTSYDFIHINQEYSLENLMFTYVYLLLILPPPFY